MAQEPDEGLAYLQALKQSAPAAATVTRPPHEPSAGETPYTVPVHNSGSPQLFPGMEKRRSPRYRCQASVEICPEGSESRTWATCTDVSMHGCYVEASTTYPVGTDLLLKLQTGEFQVQTKGCIRVTYSSLGMGIAFVEMPEETRSSLRELLRNISRPSAILGTGGAPPVPASDSPLSIAPPSDATAALRALAEFFESRQLLMRDEFLRIVRKSQANGKPALQIREPV